MMINTDELPQDLVMEIVLRLPVKSVARFLLVSKLWAKFITSRYFIRSFPAGSHSSQPRLLVCFIGSTRPRTLQNWYFFSSSSSSTSFLSRVRCHSSNCAYFDSRSPYVNGLIRLGYGNTKLIRNPSTGKSITLPSLVRYDPVNNPSTGKPINLSTVVRVYSRSFFGYDPVNDHYKILLTKKNLPNDIQHGQESARREYLVLTLFFFFFFLINLVLTLGADEQSPSWRTIDYSIPHSYCSGSHVCIDGVIYFVAKTGADLSQRSLMKFDLRYEKLDLVTSLSSDMQSLRGFRLINYVGKVAITSSTSGHTFNVWVIDQAGREPGWSKISFGSESWKSLSKLRIYGGSTTHTGEFVLGPKYYCDDFSVILYNPNTCGLRKIKVDVEGDYEFKYERYRALVFPEYVESIRLLSEEQFHSLG